MQKEKQKKATEHRDTAAKPQQTPAEQHIKGDYASQKPHDHSSQANQASEEHSKK